MIFFALPVLLLAPWIGWPWAIAGVIATGILIQTVIGIIGVMVDKDS